MKRKYTAVQMFNAAEDLPLFSGTAQRASLAPYKPQETARNLTMFGPLEMHTTARKVTDTPHVFVIDTQANKAEQDASRKTQNKMYEEGEL